MSPVRRIKQDANLNVISRTRKLSIVLFLYARRSAVTKKAIASSLDVHFALRRIEFVIKNVVQFSIIIELL